MSTSCVVQHVAHRPGSTITEVTASSAGTMPGTMQDILQSMWNEWRSSAGKLSVVVLYLINNCWMVFLSWITVCHPEVEVLLGFLLSPNQFLASFLCFISLFWNVYTWTSDLFLKWMLTESKWVDQADILAEIPSSFLSSEHNHGIQLTSKGTCCLHICLMRTFLNDHDPAADVEH